MSFSVTQLDIELDDINVGSFDFEDIRLELADNAEGTIDSGDVSIPAGELEFNVTFKLKITGSYLFGSNDFTLNFATTGAATGVVDVTGAFSVTSAVFELGDEIALLNTE